jgi:hypothetical protein
MVGIISPPKLRHNDSFVEFLLVILKINIAYDGTTYATDFSRISLLPEDRHLFLPAIHSLD